MNEVFVPYQEITYQVENRIATITLNQPKKLNAFTATMREQLIHALGRADEDDEIRVIIITGANLSKGGDTFHFDDSFRDGGGQVSLRIFENKKPLIGAINGAGVGIGATMTLPMDIRIASTNAPFGFVFSRRGVVPEACSSWFLPRIVGISQALEWVFSGRVFDAAEALSGGLVKEVMPPEYLVDRAREIAREIADNTSAV